MNQIEKVINECNNAGIDICLLKGAALILNGVYKIRERDMEDIDILIKEEELDKFESLMADSGYCKVCSGERGFYKDGENAVIDVHTDILYAGSRQLDKIREHMKNIKGAKILDKEEHFIYIMHHGLIQHGNLSKLWKDDIKKLMESGLNWEKLKCKLNRYNLTEVFYIAMKQLGRMGAVLINLSKPPPYSLKRKYIEFIISLPSFHDKGHFLRPVAVRGIKGMIIFGIKFLFPDLDFLKRRYHFRPAPLMLYFRPFLLLLKILESLYPLILSPIFRTKKQACQGGLTK